MARSKNPAKARGFAALCIHPGCERRAGKVRLTLGSLALLLSFGALASVSSQAQLQVSVAHAATKLRPRGLITSHIPGGFSVEGPIAVLSVGTHTLSLLRAKESRPLVLDLRDMEVTVRDLNNKNLSLGDLSKGTLVYVCRKSGSNHMFIFVAPQKVRANDI